MLPGYFRVINYDCRPRHSVGADASDRERYISENLLKREHEARVREEKIAQAKEYEQRERTKRILESDLEAKLTSSSVKVNPLITSGTRSTELSSIPMPLPKRATEKKYRFGSIFRVFLFLAILIVVIGFGVSAVGIYASHSYFVGTDGSDIAIYQGRPGGLLWYDPKVYKKTQLTTSDVLPYHLADLKKGVVEPSLSAALAYVHNLSNEASQVSASSTSVPTTSTTVVNGSSPTTTVAGSG